jgi:hypothetical protein
MVPWALFWAFLFIVSGLRAWFYGAGDLLVYGGAAVFMALAAVPAYVTYQMILRRWRARGWPPGERAAE